MNGKRTGGGMASGKQSALEQERDSGGTIKDSGKGPGSGFSSF